jgi:restriction system protein
MNSLEAVELVLREDGQPLHVTEITRRMLDRNLWQTAGLTPSATIDARIAVDIRDKGAASRFQRTGKSIFALRDWGLPEYQGRTVKKKSAIETGTNRVGELPTGSEEEHTEPQQLETPEVLPETISFTSAAELILQRFGNRQPMNYRDITRMALEQGLIKTRGQTPDQTMYAMILTEIERNRIRGEPGRFVKHGRGLVGLTQWHGDGLAYQIEKHNREVREKLRGRLYRITPAQFEDLVGSLLVQIGFEHVQVTSRSNDGGIDVRGTLVVAGVIRTNMAVQVKRWKNNVQAPTVQQVRGSLGTHDQGLIITTSDFSSGARQEAERPNAVPVALMNGEQLVSLLVENNLGITRTAYDLIDLDPS